MELKPTKEDRKIRPAAYDCYPIHLVLMISILQVAVYLTGAYIMFRLHLAAGILYVAFIVFLEGSVCREGCRNCYYYGKLCAFGRGKIAGLILKRGDPREFSKRELGWKDFVPQILVVLIPLIAGIAIMVSRGFDVWILCAMIYPLLSWFCLNPWIYGNIACAHCRQGRKCCPALRFFSKEKQ